MEAVQLVSNLGLGTTVSQKIINELSLMKGGKPRDGISIT